MVNVTGIYMDWLYFSISYRTAYVYVRVRNPCLGLKDMDLSVSGPFPIWNLCCPWMIEVLSSVNIRS